MTPKLEGRTVVDSCHCPDDMAVRMRKALARPWVVVRVRHLLLFFLHPRSTFILVFEFQARDDVIYDVTTSDNWSYD